MTEHFTTKEYIELLVACYMVASDKSDDLSNRNAAMVIDKNGCFGPIMPNKIPDGVNKEEDRIKVRPKKYDFIEHAERGAIYAAAKFGLQTEGGVLVVPWAACADCSRAIICSGIRKIVTHKQRNEMTSLGRDKIIDSMSDRWINPISNGMIMLQEAGVEVMQLDFTAEIKILINEQLVDI